MTHSSPRTDPGAAIAAPARWRSLLAGSCTAGLLLGAGLLSTPAQSAIILLGSDYLETMQPTFFAPLGALNPLQGLPFGPGTTDTVVQRQRDCSLDLLSSGPSCTVPIEMVALSLQSTVDPLVLLRESPTLASTGSMTMRSDGSGSGGTFDSFFDVFVELSLDGGGSWTPFPNFVPLSATGTGWTTVQPPSPPQVIVTGLAGDQNANTHTDRNCPTGGPNDTCDFYLVGNVQEQHPSLGMHTATPSRIPRIPEPATLALLAIGLAGLGIGRRRPIA